MREEAASTKTETMETTKRMWNEPKKSILKNASGTKEEKKTRSSIDRMKPVIISGLATLFAIYFALVFFLRGTSWAVPDEEYCPPGSKRAFFSSSSKASNHQHDCTRPDLLAFQLTSFLALCYCGMTGYHIWHIRRQDIIYRQVPAHTPQGRVFGYIRQAEELAAMNFTFQIWDLVVSLLLIEEHATPIMIMHHIIAAIASWSSLECQYLHYYAIFFLGLSEFSSIFLVFVDMAKFFPPTPGSLYDVWVGICGPCFAVTFIVYRVILWWKVSFDFFGDCIHVLRSGLADTLRPGKVHVIYLFLTMNIPMGLLQLYWFQIIVREVLKVLAGESWSA